MRILFILKHNECYGFTTYTRRSAGLWNSTSFIVKGLAARGVHASIVEVADNNEIDREVAKFKPNIVIIEALWVVPEKFDILKKLHPNVKWFCHLHSHMPFLALEGIAMEWLKGYADRGIGLIANSLPSYEALRVILSKKELIYLPNVYLGKMRSMQPNDDDLHIGCFGAVRPLKNQLLQALAAIKFSREKGRKLKFYVNSSRLETGGQPVLKNLQALFSQTPDTELVEIHWCEPEEFIEVLWSKIEIGMQVSLTETFNVVCADYVTAGVPTVASKEIVWLSPSCKAKDDDIDDIVKVMHRVYRNRWLVFVNQMLLRYHSYQSQRAWYKFVKNNS